jgi:type IV pilus assembly protein PilW
MRPFPPASPRAPSPPKQRGFTLIELMVSLTIGMMIVITIGYVYLGASRTFRALEASSRMQENARYAVERIGFDLRMAGYTGCSYSTVANVLNDPSAWENNLFGQPLAGYESGTSTYPDGVAGNVLRGDALSILRADNAKEYIVDSHNPNSAQFQLTANHDLKQGEILVVTDCSHAAVFQMTNVNNNNTIKTVNHNTGTGTPGNCTKGFGLPVDCSNTNGTDYTFKPGSRLYRLNAATYYIRTNAEGEPALYRQKLGYDDGDSALTAEEVVEGIEDMQITYGVDTTATADGAVDTYVTANQVAVAAPGSTGEEDWKRVLSIRVSLLLASREGEVATTKAQTYSYNGATVTPSDRRLRKVFTTTIAIRNRL